MSDIITERSNGILRVELNRPEKKNALTAAMYTSLAEIFNDAGKDESVHVVLWHAAGDAFCAGNDMRDFLKNPPGPGNFPQGYAMDALIGFEKPIVAAVHGVAIGGGTTMLGHCDFVYAGESTKFAVPFIDLALMPEFGSSFLLPRNLGYLRAAELILLGRPFDAAWAAEIGLVTRVVPDPNVLATATETAQSLAKKPAAALLACKRFLKRTLREPLQEAVKLENEEFAVRVNSPESKAVFAAFLAKHQHPHSPRA